MKTQAMWVPRAENRRAWHAVSVAARTEIHSAAEALRRHPYPALTATQYMAFAKSGDRRVLEMPYFARRKQLILAVLAECLQPRGRFIEDIVDGLWCVCEETSWCVSAHNASGLPLPDADNPVIDLFAAQTAALISWTCYLLEEALPGQVFMRGAREVSLRLLEPFARRDDFWWMGFAREKLNNWTPWILSNVLACAHIWGRDMDTRAAAMLDRWLADVPEDGGLDEGVAYWNMAGGSLLDCLDHLGAHRYEEAKIRNLALFPLRAHIDGAYFINFADCDARPHLDGERVYTFGKRIGSAPLIALGMDIALRSPSVLPPDTPELYRVLCRLLRPVPPPSKAIPPDDDGALPDLQLWTCRRKGLYAAVKGGHNAESHNHNDVGAFLVYVDGEPAIVDAGNMVYTAQTFRDETRYALWNTRSMNHNVPLIGAFEQAAGAEYAAQGVSLCPEGATMDIAGAYPKEAGVQRLGRSFFYEAPGFVLEDDIVLRAPRPVTWVFLLRYAPLAAENAVRAGNVSLQWEAGLRCAIDEYSVQDERMARSYPGSLYRVALTAPPADTHRRKFWITRCEG